MLKIKFFCRFCASTKDTLIKDRVPQKIDMFFAECDKGHIFEVYVTKRMMKLLKESRTVKSCPECGSEKIVKTGFGHGVGTGNRIPHITSWGYRCEKCENFFNLPK